MRHERDLTVDAERHGRVNRIELAPDGNVRILIDVPTTDARWLRTSSVFTLERGLVGDARLRAFSAIPDDPPLPPNAKRPVLRGDAGEQIPQVLASARSLLANLERLTADGAPLGATLGHVESDLHALRSEVETSLRKASQLIAEINRQWPFPRDTEIRLP